jgi:hypothetical protein
MFKFLRPLCGTLALVTLATAAQAQATIQATATVSAALATSGQKDLEFGQVFAGFTKQVAHNTPGAGRFHLQGGASAQVSVSFTLPTSLSQPAPATGSFPIGTFTGCRSNTNNNTTGCTIFTPSAAAQNMNLSATGELYLFVGATVSPANPQAPGAYSAAIVLTAAYTGA